jgi:hypothetical protein
MTPGPCNRHKYRSLRVCARKGGARERQKVDAWSQMQRSGMGHISVFLVNAHRREIHPKINIWRGAEQREVCVPMHFGRRVY